MKNPSTSEKDQEGKRMQPFFIDFGPLVPLEHRVDGFGQLSTALLVNAARINPGIG